MCHTQWTQVTCQWTMDNAASGCMHLLLPDVTGINGHKPSPDPVQAGSRVVDSISCRCVWVEEQVMAALQLMVKPRSPGKKPPPAATTDNGSVVPQVGAAQQQRLCTRGFLWWPGAAMPRYCT